MAGRRRQPSRQETALPSFYELTPGQHQLLRARRAELASTITECDRNGFMLWVFCVWCGNTRSMEACILVAQVKEPPNMIDELERRLRCEKCHRLGVRLLPTDRTSVSFDRMGISAR